MKGCILALFLILLSAGISLAENLPPEPPQGDTNTQTTTGASSYKTSPRLSYKSKKPDEKNSALGNMKPMLNQMLGNGANGSGPVMPNGGTYSF